MIRYFDDGYNVMFGTEKYSIKKCPDPLTDVILRESAISSDEDIVNMARDIFGYHIKQNPGIFARNLFASKN